MATLQAAFTQCRLPESVFKSLQDRKVRTLEQLATNFECIAKEIKLKPGHRARLLRYLKDVSMDPQAMAPSGDVRYLFDIHGGPNEPKIAEHVKAVLANKSMYLQHLDFLLDTGVATLFTPGCKTRVLVAVCLHDLKAAKKLLETRGFLQFVDVAKAIEMLDGPRKIRQLEKKLERLTLRLEQKDKKTALCKPKTSTLHKLSTQIKELKKGELWPSASLTRSRQKLFSHWMSTIPKEALQFFLLSYPTKPWKEALDLLHLKNGRMQLDYFQGAVFGKPIPGTSLVATAKALTRENLASELKKTPQLAKFYSYIRKNIKDTRPERKKFNERVHLVEGMGFGPAQAEGVATHFWGRNVSNEELMEWLLSNPGTTLHIDKKEVSSEAKGLIATHMPLLEAIWWYHELACKQAEEAVHKRLEAKEPLEGNYSGAYGKLMERLLSFREQKRSFSELLLPYAEKRLLDCKLTGSGRKIVIAGDASGSMEVAIKSATILGSLLSCVLDATLIFFHEEVVQPPCQPRSAQDVIKVVEGVPAKGATSMAAALWPYYEKKEKIDMMVLVSDEGENIKCNGYFFAELLEKYRAEVSPNFQVVLVSFLPVGDEGTILKRLRERKIQATQHRLDASMPDTSKFDGIMGLISLACKELADGKKPKQQAKSESKSKP